VEEHRWQAEDQKSREFLAISTAHDAKWGLKTRHFDSSQQDLKGGEINSEITNLTV